MPQQYWTRSGQQTLGPYSAIQLRSLAQSGRLQPQDQVSADRQKWVLAQQVRGLEFATGLSAPPIVGAMPGSNAAAAHRGPTGQEPPMAELAADEPPEAVPVEDSAEALPDLLPDDLLSGIPGPSADANLSALGIATPLPSTNQLAMVVGSDALEIRQQGRGLLLGLLLALLGLLFTGLMIQAVQGSGPLVAVIALVGLLASVGMIVVATMGTSRRMHIMRRGDGTVTATLVQVCGFLPVYKQVYELSRGARLVKEAKRTASKQQVDAMMIVITIVLLAMGGCPGIIFWFVWANQRNMADGGCYLRLYLEPERGTRVLLFAGLVRDYFGTRFGDPKVVVRMTNFFRDSAGIETVERLL